MALNGVLAGLVGITAGADQMAMYSAIAIGLIAGLIVVPSVLFFDRIKIDDPVGAISVHLVCGIWGTLAVGIFGQMAGLGQLWTQFVGVVFYGIGSVTIAGVLFAVIRATMGLRVTEEEEIEGLDLAEHGQHAYDLGTGTGASIYDEVTSSISLRSAEATEGASRLASSNT
jgi:Amt family ammonium transporter